MALTSLELTDQNDHERAKERNDREPGDCDVRGIGALLSKERNPACAEICFVALRR